MTYYLWQAQVMGYGGSQRHLLVIGTLKVVLDALATTLAEWDMAANGAPSVTLEKQ